MLLERRTVSRKTPGDGRLEITKRAAGKIGEPGRRLQLRIDGESAPAAVVTMACACRGADNPHEHYFLESTALKGLVPGSEVDLDLGPDGVVRVTESR